MIETLTVPDKVWLNTEKGKDTYDNYNLIRFYRDEVVVVCCKIAWGKVNEIRSWFPLKQKWIQNSYQRGFWFSTKSLGIIRGTVGSWIFTLLSCQPYTGRPTYKGAAGLINREYHYCKYRKLQETSLKVLVYNKKLRCRPEPLGEFIIPYAGSPAVSSARPLTRFHSWALTPAGRLLITNIRNFGIRSPTRY